MGRKQGVFPKELVQVPHKGLCYQAKVVWLPWPPNQVSPIWEKDPYLKAEQRSFRHQKPTIQPMLSPCPRTEPILSPHLKHPVINVQPPCPPPRTTEMPLPHLHHQNMLNKIPSSLKHHVVTSVLPINRSDIPSTKPAVTLTSSKQYPPLQPIRQTVIPLYPNHHSEASTHSEHFTKILPGCSQLAGDPSHLKQQAPFPSFAEAPPCEVHRTMFIAVPQKGPNSSVKVTTNPVNPGQETLPKPRHQIRATNALLGFLKLEPMLHSAGSISTAPNHQSKETTSKPSGMVYWTQPKRPSSHSNLFCPWKTVSLLYCNDHLPKSLGVSLSHQNLKTSATAASGPDQLSQAGDATGPMAHGLCQTMPVRTNQDQGARQLPLGLHFQGKTLQIPNHQMMPPSHPKDPLHPITQVSFKMEQKHRKTMPLTTDNQATNPTGQDHWVIPPSTIQPQSTTLAGIGQNLKTVSYKQDINQFGTIPKATTSLNSDYYIRKVTNPNAHLTYQTNLELWGKKTARAGHQNMSPFIWGHGASSLPQSTDSKATIPLNFDLWTTPLPQTEFQTNAIPDPNVQFLLQPEPKHHETRQTEANHQFIILIDQNQGATTNSLDVEEQKTTLSDPNHGETMARVPPRHEQQPVTTSGPDSYVLFQLEQEHRESMPPKTEIWTPTPVDQDLTLVSSLGVDNQDSTQPISKDQATLLVSPTHQPEDILGNPKAQVSLQEELKECDTIPEDTDRQSPNPTDNGQGTTLPLSTDDKKTTSSGPDHHQAMDIPDPNDQELWKLKLEHSETKQSATEQHSKNPIDKDHGATFPHLHEDKQEITLCGPNHQDNSHIGLDDLTEDRQDPRDQDSVQPDGQHWQMVQPGIDQQITNPTDQDHTEITLTLGTENQETSLACIGHQAIPPLRHDFWAEDTANPITKVSGETEQENKERMPLGKEHEITTLLGHDRKATIALVGSDPQDKTMLDPENYGSFPPNPDPNVDTLGPVTHTLMQSEQGLCETMTLKTDQQAADKTGCDHWVTRPLPGSDHQTTCPLSHNLSGAHISIQKEREERETLLKEIDYQDSILSEVDIMPIPIVGLDPQEKKLPSPDCSATLPHNFENQAKDTIEPMAPVGIQIEQEPGEIMSLTIDHQATAIAGQDQEAAKPPLDTAQCGQNTPLHGPDYRDENMPALNTLVSLQPLANKCETVPQETDQQATILMDLGFRASCPLLINPQDPTLSDSDYQPIPPYGSSETFSDPYSQNAPPTDPKCSAKWLSSDHQVTDTTILDPQVTLLPSSTNQTEARLDSTKLEGTPPTQLCNQETALLSFTKHRAVLSSGPSLQVRHLKGRDPQAEVEFDSQVHIPSRLQNQTRSVLNEKSPCLNYVKPYTAEGGMVPNRIVQAIISSIPQEKIKNDIYKQNLLRQTRKFSPHNPSRYSSSYYPVCLLCTSWIPNGCPHSGMKYSFEAQLLAIPTPMPGFEELGVKFVLQVPPMTTCSFLDFPYSHNNLQKYLHSPGAFSASSYSDLEFSRSSRPKWLHFILGKAHQPVGRTQGPGFIDEIPLRRLSPREEEIGNGRTFFKSLLERFLWNLRD